jgi:hypothetical protein
MRLRITTLAAGQHVDVALFRYIKEGGKRLLKLVPGTYVEFNATTAGVKTIDVQHTSDPYQHPVVRTDGIYFIGYNADSAVLRFRSIDIGASPVIGLRETPYVSGGPHEIDLDATTESSENHFPMIVFLSHVAAEVL